MERKKEDKVARLAHAAAAVAVVVASCIHTDSFSLVLHKNALMLVPFCRLFSSVYVSAESGGPFISNAAPVQFVCRQPMRTNVLLFIY